MAEQERIAKKRAYTLRGRATAMDRTRARITKAAVELHGTVGPANTTMSAVAARAGVTRATLYRHFADEATLFEACSGEWIAAHPAPAPTDLPPADRRTRLAAALDAVYAWYRADRPMHANLRRDVDALPAALGAGLRSFGEGFVDELAPDWSDRQPASGMARVRAALALAFAFETWRLLADRGLSDAESRDLMIELIRRA